MKFSSNFAQFMMNSASWQRENLADMNHMDMYRAYGFIVKDLRKTAKNNSELVVEVMSIM